MKPKETKKIEAEERKQGRGNRSAKEQLRVLDARLGEGVGAMKERQRLVELALTEGE